MATETAAGVTLPQPLSSGLAQLRAMGASFQAMNVPKSVLTARAPGRVMPVKAKAKPKAAPAGAVCQLDWCESSTSGKAVVLAPHRLSCCSCTRNLAEMKRSAKRFSREADELLKQAERDAKKAKTEAEQLCRSAAVFQMGVDEAVARETGASSSGL